MPEEGKLTPTESSTLERESSGSYTVVDLEREGVDTYAYLRAYWKVLSKYRWTIFTVVFVTTTLAAIYSFKQEPIYRATVEVEVDSEMPAMQSVNNLYQTVPTDPTFLQTQVDVLTSDDLAWHTIQDLKLDQNPAFNAAVSRPGTGPQETAAKLQSRLIAEFKGALHVDLVTGSRMIKVSFESTNPQLAARVANALVNNYTEYNFLTKYDSTRQASGWMANQLDELKAKMEKSQQAVVSYEKENSIVNIDGKESVEDQRLSDLSQDLTVAQNDLADKESLYQLVKANPQKVGILAQDPLLQTLEEKYADLQTSYVNALAQYGPKFPKVVRLRDQVNAIQSLIQQARARTVERIKHNYKAALGRVHLLTNSVAKEKAAVEHLNQLMIQHTLLKHEFETNEQLYDSLLMKVKDATVSAGLKANNVHIVDHARVPLIPVLPRKKVNIAIGFLVGLILGITLAFVREIMDTSLKTAEDVERSIARPVLGVIPAANSLRTSSWFNRRKPGRRESDNLVEWAVLKNPTSVLAESYHTLRTAVLLSAASAPPQAILITSSQPFEGKTSTAFNLAVGLTQIGRKVLFIDADLRQPGLRRLVDTTDRVGLSNVLTGANTAQEALFQLPDLSNLWLLSAGPRPPNPADLLSSKAMENLLSTLRRDFDHLVLDTPPVMMVADATTLSPFVDGVILVTESQVTGKASLIRTHQILQNAGAKILGCVVNKLDLQHDGYYGRSYRYYGHYYRAHAQDDTATTPPVPSNGRQSDSAVSEDA